MTDVTVLMAVYNGGRFVKDAVDSVLAQSGVEFEFVVVDDGSTDDTRAILAAAQDPRLTVVTNDQNAGLTASLNRGLALARGTFVARMDADDACLPGRLAAQARTLQSGKAAISFCRCFLEDEATGKREIWTEGDWPLIRWRGLFTNSYGKHSAAMFRRDAVLTLGGYDPSFRRAQDYDLWDRCIAAGLGVVYVREPLLRYRLHENAITVRHGVEQQAAACLVSGRALGREFPGFSEIERAGLRWLMLGQPADIERSTIVAALARLSEAATRFSHPRIWQDVAQRLARRLGSVDTEIRVKLGHEMIRASFSSKSWLTVARSVRARVFPSQARSAA